MAPISAAAGGLGILARSGGERESEFGRTSPPIEADGLVCLGSLGVVSCFDGTSGALAWSRRFPVTQFRALAPTPRGICALAGGFYLHRKDSVGDLRETPFNGLYCVTRADGSPLPGFETPFSSNRPGVPLTSNALEYYDSGGDDVKLATNGAPPGEKSTRFNALAAIKPGILVAQDEVVRLVELPSGKTLATTDLTDLGRVRQLASAGDTVVASAAKGFAGFDVASGAFRWKTSFVLGAPLLMAFSDHEPEGLVRPMPTFSHQMDSDDLRKLDFGVYWLLPRLRTIVASGKDGGMVGISVDDGAVLWRLAQGGTVAIDGPEDHPSLVSIDKAVIRVYRLPSATPAQPAPN